MALNIGIEEILADYETQAKQTIHYLCTPSVRPEETFARLRHPRPTTHINCLPYTVPWSLGPDTRLSF